MWIWKRDPRLPSVSAAAKGKVPEEAKDSLAPRELRSSVPSPTTADVPKDSNQPIPPAGADIHALLCQKIAALQAERQSRWQKIIGFLAGKQSGEAMP